MTPPRYSVTLLNPAAVAFTELLRLADEIGTAAPLVADYRRILERLADDPFGFGEGREHLLNSKIHTRVGFQGRLIVDYGIHETAPLVWIQRLRLQRARGER